MKDLSKHVYEWLRKVIVTNRRLVVILVHLLQAYLANYLAFSLRFDALPSDRFAYTYYHEFVGYLPLLIFLRLVFYLQGGLYRDLWRYSSVGDLIRLVKAVTFGSLLFVVLVRFVGGEAGYPRSIFIIDWLLLIMFAGGTLLSVRVFKDYVQDQPAGKRVLLFGAGDGAEMIVRDMKFNPQYQYQPIGLIDDDPNKKGLKMHGVPIFGGRNMIAEVVGKHRPEEVVIAIPSFGPAQLKEIYDLFKPFNVPIKTLPRMSDILDGKVSVSQIKPLSLEDLLQREPVRYDISEVKEYLGGKTVLVTGAGGSIGSELCRQIVKYHPAKLVLFDRYENGLFAIDNELRAESKEQRVVAVVGDMRDIDTLEHLFAMHRPHIVFHAAAHKHVPLMELNPVEAVKNNVFGTDNVINAASRHNAERFVMISTDKAVNPTNVMGATKRVGEFLAMSMNGLSPTKFTTVRFGNVLGSNGSVVPTFREQVRRGGPVTVTHPEIKRFFMLIPEAAHLVLIAAAGGKGGDILVLEMGEQIRIVDLAENLIRLSGFIPHEDIKIEFTGLRPGEKLYEELFDESEIASPSWHEKLKTAFPLRVPTRMELEMKLAALRESVSAGDFEKVVIGLQKIVPNFRRDGQDPQPLQ